MRIRRSLPILVGVLLVAGAIALVVVLRKHAPPEPARLLPGADGFAYIDLKWMRRANLLGQLPDVPHDPEYQQFVEATGIEPERDLEEAALAIHYPNGADKNTGELRYSEVLIGHFQNEKLTAYLKKIGGTAENYRSAEIYSIPLQNRTVRVAILAVDTVAASNLADPLVIRGMIDRSRKMASPFGGPALLRQYYKEVPLASLAWGIVKADPTETASPQPLQWSFLFSRPAVIVSSIRYLGNVHLKAEAFTLSEDDAAQVSQRLTTFLTAFTGAQNSTANASTDPDIKALFDSVRIEQHNARATLTAVAPIGFFRKIFSEAPTAEPDNPPATPQAPAAKPAGKSKKHR